MIIFKDFNKIISLILLNIKKLTNSIIKIDIINEIIIKDDDKENFYLKNQVFLDLINL